MKKPKKLTPKPDIKAEVEAAQARNKDAFELTARRVIAAVGELNDAMAEAHKNSEMRVEFWPVAGPLPRTYDYRIYKLTHAAMTWFVEHDEKTGNMVGRYEPASPKPDGNVQAAGGDIGTGAIGKTRRAP